MIIQLHKSFILLSHSCNIAFEISYWYLHPFCCLSIRCSSSLYFCISLLIADIKSCILQVDRLQVSSSSCYQYNLTKMQITAVTAHHHHPMPTMLVHWAALVHVHVHVCVPTFICCVRQVRFGGVHMIPDVVMVHLQHIQVLLHLVWTCSCPLTSKNTDVLDSLWHCTTAHYTADIKSQTLLCSL